MPKTTVAWNLTLKIGFGPTVAPDSGVVKDTLCRRSRSADEDPVVFLFGDVVKDTSYEEINGPQSRGPVGITCEGS